ncbi:MAG: polysaccharide lyase family 8 super-sandwich domain-containing protein [Victivallaceae bacterium]|nr:polysaccharide lyase family 8 super-sandwich domain-containing protein [Victivallaceae bacterium]
MKQIAVIFLILSALCLAASGNPTKEDALLALREKMAAAPFRAHVRTSQEKLTFSAVERTLREDGRFSDLIAEENALANSPHAIAKLTTKAFHRIWTLSESFRTKNDFDQKLRKRLFRAILHYGKIEHDRDPGFTGRWTQSCFDIPTAAVNTFFAFYPLMRQYETAPAQSDKMTSQVHAMLSKLALQAWTIPSRGDATDRNYISVERFRNDTLWVGANAIGYRPALQAAILLNSVPMLDVMAQVAKKALSPTSFRNAAEAFWSEGFTSDGAGWGHGRQCYVWGYPVDGALAAGMNLALLRDTPWAATLEKQNKDAILNFIRRSAFYYYKGFEPPVSGRSNFDRKKLTPSPIKAALVAELFLKHWPDAFTPEEQKELREYLKESRHGDPLMMHRPAGEYHSSWYFFDNDDMIHKNADYYIHVNMASSRVDGVESAVGMDDAYNLFSADGATLFQRRGDEYRRSFGAIDLYAYPGVTTRRSPEVIRPVRNWRGYHSTFDFAGGATFGKDFAAGFLFRKADGARRMKAPAMKHEVNPFLYAVRACKSYFLFGDTFLALGAGIVNEKPEFPGTITTSVEQTLLAPDSRREGEWEINNRFAYRVLREHTTGTVSTLREKRRTRWHELNPRNGKEEESVEIFQLTIDHGKNPDGGRYAYVVDCSGSIPSKLPRILSNTPKLQAAENAEGTVLGAVFFDAAATLDAPSFGRIRVDAPCVLLGEKVNGQVRWKVFEATSSPRPANCTVTPLPGGIESAGQRSGLVQPRAATSVTVAK